MEITFRVIGEPKGQPRPRAFAFAGRARVYDPGTAENWKSQIAEAARPHIPQVPFTGPCEMSVTFWMPRPKSHYRTGKNAGVLKDGAPVGFTAKPDLDNLLKAALDALTTLGMFADDSQVIGFRHTRKEYAPSGERPGAFITLWF